MRTICLLAAVVLHGCYAESAQRPADALPSSGSGGAGGGAGGSGGAGGGAGGPDTSNEIGGDVVLERQGDSPIGVLCDGDNIYWLGATTGKLFRSSLAGDDSTELGAFSPPPTILRDSPEHLYIASATRIDRWSKATGESERVVASSGIGDVAANWAAYYWIADAEVGSSDGLNIATNAKPLAITANEDTAFWVAEDSTVYKLPSGRTVPTPIGSGSGTTGPGRIDVTGGVVVWGSSVGLRVLVTSGGAPAMMQQGDILLLDADGASVLYVLSRSPGPAELHRLDLITSERRSIATSNSFTSITQCDGAIYWSNWLGEVRTDKLGE